MNRRRWPIALAALAIAAGLSFAACGDDDDEETRFDGTPAGTVAAPTPGSPEPRPTSGIPTTLAIDANAATPEVDASASFPVGTEFGAAFVLEQVGGPYHGYQFDVWWNKDVLAYVRVDNLTPAGLTFCSPIVTLGDGEEGVTPGDDEILAFCANSQLMDQEFEGAASHIVFRCDKPGTSQLNLMLPGEVIPVPTPRGARGTSVLRTEDGGAGSIAHDLTMRNASVTCT